jgi:hypothetical protein
MITATQKPVMPRNHYLNDNYGIRSWLLTKDHKRIAILYLISITFFFFLGGLFAALIRFTTLGLDQRSSANRVTIQKPAG